MGNMERMIINTQRERREEEIDRPIDSAKQQEGGATREI